ncbi:MAG: gamma carbonic anhydrase family protein [Ilumatobacteraceae bacterium]|nr:gamma carbonic anhydrase family protein [Ilumatobacteraceae bacterium]
MPIYALGDQIPNIHETAYVHPDAVVIGSVSIGAQSTIWPSAVLRGDDGEIFIGARTSIQDGAVVHTTPQYPTTVGDDCVIGHLAHLEGCRIADKAQVSSGAVVLHNVTVGSGAIVGANAVVLNNTVVPPGSLAVGAPAIIKPDRASQEDIEFAAMAYVAKGKRFNTSLRLIK